MKLKCSLLFTALLYIITPVLAQTSSNQAPQHNLLSATTKAGAESSTKACPSGLPEGSKQWSINKDYMPGNIKAFEENRGQFKNFMNDWTIAYGANCQGNQILFTPKGFIYYVPEKVKLTEEEERERNKNESIEQQEKEKENYKVIAHKVSIEWENANPDPQIEAIDKTPYYFGCVNPEKQTGIDNIPGFKKLIYHNVYPGIDIEFTFHPEKGIKYAVKVQPGADPSKFKMLYKGDQGISIDADGNVHIKTPVGDIIDRAPVSKQNGKAVTSSFQKLSDNEISFKLGAVNKSSELTIDPWTYSPVTAGYIPSDISMDNSNNVYVLNWDGGTFSGTCVEQKYSAGGLLVWTYNMTQYSTQTSIGDMTIDPATGNTYTANPYYYFNLSGGSYALICLTSGGLLSYFYNTYNNTGGTVFETWNISWSCQLGKLCEAGSPTITEAQAGCINAANGQFTGPLYQNTAVSELYSGCIAPNGNYYTMAANYCFCNNHTEVLMALNVTGTSPTYLWQVPLPLYNYADFSFKNPAGVPQNAITAGCNDLYTTDGVTVYDIDETTGAVKNTATIPGGVNTSSTCNSGIVVDPICGYVYVGGQTNVQVFSNTLAPVTTWSAPGIVYDVTFRNGLVTACGATSSGVGWVEQYTALTCPPPVTITNSKTTCGANNGTATVNPTFCSTPYSYLWTPTGQTTQTATGLSAGTYTVTVSTAASCTGITVTDTVTILPSPPSFTFTKATTASLCTSSTGTATVTVTGGSSPYTYLWSNGETTSTATGLSSGVYCLTITDNSGCSDSVCLTVPNAGGLVVSINPFKNVTCYNGNNGSATAVATGGTTPYTYLWSNSATTSSVTTLTAGSYTVVVTDNNGCNTNATVTITQPTQLRDSIVSFKNPKCNNSSDGSATVGVKGGTGKYTYSWTTTPAQTTATASNISAGTYTITVTDSNGCTNSASVTLANPTPVVVTTTTSPSTCVGNTGSATATVTGGTGGTYKYSWSTVPLQTNATATGLASGSYTITATDSNGCTGTATALVGNLGGESDTIVDVINVKCYLGKTASAKDSAFGGSPPYTYSWSTIPAQTNATATGLSAGTYTVTTHDSKSCLATAIITITQPAQLRDSITNTTNVTCFGLSDGSATVGVKGGTIPYTYTWTPAGGTAATASGITAATYTVTVTDGNGCTVSASTTITQPAALKVTAAGFPTTCNAGSNGQATVIPGGGTVPYTYAWSNGSTKANTSNLVAGNYTITVTDAHGCTADTVVAVTQPAPVVVAFAADTLAGCYPLCTNFTDGSSDPNGTINKWSWNFGDKGTDTNKNPRHCYSSPGVYDVSLIVTDNNGCTGNLTISKMITVYDHPHPDFIFGPQPTTIFEPTINFTDKSSDLYGIVSWLWNFNDPYSDTVSLLPDPSHKYSDTGVFCPQLTVTNVHGCVDSVSHCLVISPQFTLYIPDAFTPNGDGLNDVFSPKGAYVYDYNLYVFDRWGLMIFHSTDIYNGWNGTLGGNLCQEDTYVYLVTCTDNLGKKHSYIGKVTLIK